MGISTTFERFSKSFGTGRMRFHLWWWNGRDTAGNWPSWNCECGNNGEIWDVSNGGTPPGGGTKRLGYSGAVRFGHGGWSGYPRQCTGYKGYRGRSAGFERIVDCYMPMNVTAVMGRSIEAGYYIPCPIIHDITALTSRKSLTTPLYDSISQSAAGATSINITSRIRNPYGENVFYQTSTTGGNVIKGHSTGGTRNITDSLTGFPRNCRVMNMPCGLVDDAATSSNNPWAWKTSGGSSYYTRYTGATTYSNMAGPGISVSRNGNTIVIRWSGSGNSTNPIVNRDASSGGSHAKRTDTITIKNLSGGVVKTFSVNMYSSGSVEFSMPEAANIHGKYSITGLANSSGGSHTYTQEFGPYPINAAHPVIYSVASTACYETTCDLTASIMTPNGEDARVDKYDNTYKHYPLNTYNTATRIYMEGMAVGRNNTYVIANFHLVQNGTPGTSKVSMAVSYATCPTTIPAIPMTVTRDRQFINVNWTGRDSDYPYSYEFGTRKKNVHCGRKDTLYVYKKGTSELIFSKQVDMSIAQSHQVVTPEPCDVIVKGEYWGLPKKGNPTSDKSYKMTQQLASAIIPEFAPTLTYKGIKINSDSYAILLYDFLNPRNEKLAIRHYSSSYGGNYTVQSYGSSYVKREVEAIVRFDQNRAFNPDIRVISSSDNDIWNPKAILTHSKTTASTKSAYEMIAPTVRRQYEKPTFLAIEWRGASGNYPYYKDNVKLTREDYIIIYDDAGTEVLKKTFDWRTDGTFEYEIFSGGRVEFGMNSSGFRDSKDKPVDTINEIINEIPFQPAYTLWVKKEGIFKKALRVYIKKGDMFKNVGKISCKKKGSFRH